MSALNPIRRKPILSYRTCLILWLLLGPLGAAPAMSRRWVRAALEAGLTISGLIMAQSVIAAAGRGDGAADALAQGIPMPWQAWWAFLALSMSMGLWISDYWRLRFWHGVKADPLLDSTTEDP